MMLGLVVCGLHCLSSRNFCCALICSVSYISAADIAAWQVGSCNDSVSSAATMTTATHTLPSAVE